MLNLKEDIRSLSDFKRNTPEALEQLRDTHRPMVLTVNGRAEMVVQDADSYQKTLEELERLRTNEGIREGLKAASEGKSRPAGVAIAAIKRRRALSR